MSESVEYVVIGAGVVGLAVARALAMQGREVIVLERHPTEGQETSSRNSGVIHSGIYYPRKSLKARLCVRGRDLLYEFCRTRHVAYQRCGKVIVASRNQLARLHALLENGRQNGVGDLELLSASQARELEPEVLCDAAIWSPSTGIIDVHEFMSCLLADLESHGGAVVFDTRFLKASSAQDGFEVTTESGGDAFVTNCRTLINAAGLEALPVLSRIEGYPAERLRNPRYAKGQYFSCRGSAPFRHLVYPLPGEAGLGIHATLDLNGRTRFGPDVEWVSALSYEVDVARAASFYAAIREYWPGLPDGSLEPDYSGIRPKLVGPGEPAADFVIEGHESHGLGALVNLLGIESPGLTSALAIGELVSSLCASRPAGGDA